MLNARARAYSVDEHLNHLPGYDGTGTARPSHPMSLASFSGIAQTHTRQDEKTGPEPARENKQKIYVSPDSGAKAAELRRNALRTGSHINQPSVKS